MSSPASQKGNGWILLSFVVKLAVLSLQRQLVAQDAWREDAAEPATVPPVEQQATSIQQTEDNASAAKTATVKAQKKKATNAYVKGKDTVAKGGASLATRLQGTFTAGQ